MAKERADLVYMSVVAEQAGRYEEMAEFIKKAALTDPDFSIEERNLMSVAFKNLIGARRAAWRILSSIEEKEKHTGGSQSTLACIKKYREEIDKEISSLANDVITLLDDRLIPAANSDEAKIFFFKMKGDYYRYIAEYATGQTRKDLAEKALVAYKFGSDIADGLPPTNPVRLGLALNFSVFYFEILDSPDRACQLAKSAFDGAIKEVDNIPESSYKDSTLIMQLLRDNLTLWTMKSQEDPDPDVQNVANDDDDD